MRVRRVDRWTGLWLAVTAWAMARTLSLMIDGDTFLNLNAGRVVAEHGIARTDTLTLVAHGRDWVDQQWLANLAFSGAEAAGGLAAVGLLAAAAWLAALTVLVLDLRARGLPGPRAAVIGFTALVGTVAVTTARAQVLSLLLFAVVLVLLSRAQERPRLAWWCIPVLVLWANVHGSVLVGVGLVGAWLLSGVLRRRAVPLRAGVLACALLAPLCTPYGVHTLDYLHGLAFNGAIREVVTEWRAPNLGDPVVAPYFALLAATAVVLVACPRRVTAFEWLTVVPLGVASLLSQRFLGFLALAAAHLLGRLWIAAEREVRPVPRALQPLTWIAAAGAVACVGYAFALGSDFERRTDMPAAAAGALRTVAADPALRVLADDQTSNYALWKVRELTGRVALDSRLELLSQREIHGFAAFLAGRGWSRSAAGYDVVVVDPTTHAALAGRVRGDPAWRVLVDTPAAVIARRRT